MATKQPAKKKTTAKSAAKKAPVKKAPAKKAPAKKAPVAKSKAKKAAEPQSFQLTKADTPFMTIAFTRQTLYWSILSIAVLAMGLWVVKIQNEINSIYDTIEAQTYSYDAEYERAMKEKAAKEKAHKSQD